VAPDSATQFIGVHDSGVDCPALALTRTLDLPRLHAPPEHGFYLAALHGCLTLCRAGEPAQHGLTVDFAAADLRRRVAAGRRSLLARALGLHRRPEIRVIDATCGLGRDSAVLAGLGCEVIALERHAALHALVADGLRRNPVARLTVRHADASAWIEQQDPAVDAIYIDPMFDNARRKARPRRQLQWLGELIGPDADAAELLATARRHATRRVVVKRHARSVPLAPPDLQFGGGKAVRFDVYLSASQDL